MLDGVLGQPDRNKDLKMIRNLGKNYLGFLLFKESCLYYIKDATQENIMKCATNRHCF